MGNTLGLLSSTVQLLLILIISTSYSYADSITLNIKQKGTGDPVEDATVVLEKIEGEPHSDDVVYEQTDKKGRVIFKNIEYPERIKVIAAGYDISINIPLSKKSEYTIYISPQVFEGETLEVNANRIIEKSSKISLSIEELKKAPGANGDPVKAITALPGVIEAEENSSAVYLRGSDSDENIFWVNRAPVGYIYHFGGFQSTLHPELVEDINIFPGGFPIEYGDALGGAIDVKLRNPKNDRKHTYIDISTITTSFLVEGPVGGAGTDSKNIPEDSYFIGGRRSYLDAILSPSDFNDDEDDDEITLVPRFYDFQALYHHNLEKGYLDTYIFSAGDEIRLNITDSAKSDPQLAGALDAKTEYQTIGQTWRQIWNKNWSHIMTLSYYHVKSSFLYGHNDDGEPYFYNTESSSFLWQPEIIHRPIKDTTLTYGIASSYKKDPLDLFSIRLPDENDINFDLTSQDKFRLKKTLYGKSFSPYFKFRKNWTENFSTTLGANYSNVSISGGYEQHEVSPRLNMEYQIEKDTLLTASWGRFVQIPDSSKIIEVFGNPALEVTESEHRIIGIEHQIDPVYTVKAEVYHKPMKNLIISIDELEPPDIYANEGTGVAYGLDLFIKRKAIGKKIGWLSASWSKSERTNEITQITRKFSGDQPWRLTAVWGQPFRGEKWKYWDWSIKAQFHSGTPYTQVTGRHREDDSDPDSRWIPEFGKHNAERTPVYYKIDLRIGRSYLFNESKLTAYIDLQNITFRKNITEYDYGDEYEYIDNPDKISGLGFFPYIGIAYEF